MADPQEIELISGIKAQPLGQNVLESIRENFNKCPRCHADMDYRRSILCAKCEAKRQRVAREQRLTEMRDGKTLEQRVAAIEEWIVDYRPPGTGVFG